MGGRWMFPRQGGSMFIAAWISLFHGLSLFRRPSESNRIRPNEQTDRQTNGHTDRQTNTQRWLWNTHTKNKNTHNLCHLRMKHQLLVRVIVHTWATVSTEKAQFNDKKQEEMHLFHCLFAKCPALFMGMSRMFKSSFQKILLSKTIIKLVWN